MKFEDLQGKPNINLSSGHTTGYHNEYDQLWMGNLIDKQGHVTDAVIGNQIQAIAHIFFLFYPKIRFIINCKQIHL